MLSYAAHRRPPAQVHPKTLILILAGHAAVLLAVMTAHGEVPVMHNFPRIKLIDLAPPEPPPPPPAARPAVKQETATKLTHADPIVKTEVPSPAPPIDPGPSLPTSGHGDVIAPIPQPVPVLPLATALVAARPLTAAGDLIPPYPDDKLRLGEEANIRVRVTIDTEGRVTSVSPVGASDPSFLNAARRHILRRWHYRPAMRGGTPIESTQTVTIRFQLDG